MGTGRPVPLPPSQYDYIKEALSRIQRPPAGPFQGPFVAPIMQAPIRTKMREGTNAKAINRNSAKSS